MVTYLYCTKGKYTVTIHIGGICNRNPLKNSQAAEARGVPRESKSTAFLLPFFLISSSAGAEYNNIFDSKVVTFLNRVLSNILDISRNTSSTAQNFSQNKIFQETKKDLKCSVYIIFAIRRVLNFAKRTK